MRTAKKIRVSDFAIAVSNKSGRTYRWTRIGRTRVGMSRDVRARTELYFQRHRIANDVVLLFFANKPAYIPAPVHPTSWVFPSKCSVILLRV